MEEWKRKKQERVRVNAYIMLHSCAKNADTIEIFDIIKQRHKDLAFYTLKAISIDS